jgi:hypothetical protein
MRTAILSLALLGSSSVSFAAPVVGVLESGNLRTSALVFCENNRIYALASDSGLSESEAVVALAEPARRMKFNRIAEDWGLGLLLLQLEESSPDFLSARLPSLASEIKSGMKAQILSASRSYSSNLIATQSDRHAFPSLKRGYEMYGDEIPFEAVGSPLLSADGSWIGIATHQALVLSPGKPTLLLERDATSLPSRHWIALPASVAASWVRDRLAGGSSSYLRIGSKQVQAGALLFTEDCPPKEREDSSPIRGEYPIGGVDAAGIGGSYSTDKVCKLRLEKAPRPAISFAFERLKPWHDRMLNAIERGLKVEIWYSVQRELGTGNLDRWTLGSLREFFRDLQNPELEPVTIVRNPQSSRVGLDPSRQALRNAASEMIRLALRRWDERVPLTTDAVGLLTRIYFMARVLESEAFALVTAEDLRRLADRKGPDYTAWGIVEWMSPKAGQRLPAELLRAAELIDAGR